MNSKKYISQNQEKFEYVSIIIYALTLILYITVGFYSPGYDDEFYNIALIEKLGTKTIKFTQNNDVHPPLSYVINNVLYNLNHNWHWVRLIYSLITSVSIIYLLTRVKKEYGNLSELIMFFLLACNPTLLMWGTSIRWYSLFISIVIWMSITPNSENRLNYWGKLFLGLLILCFTGYVGFLLIPAFFWIYWKRKQSTLKSEWIYLSVFLSLWIALYWNQFSVFLNIHLKESSSQFQSTQNNILGVLISLFSNQGIFPISILGILLILSFSIIYLTESKTIFKKNNPIFSIPYFGSSLIFVFSGIAGKFRNLLILVPWQMLWTSISIFRRKKYSLVYKLAIAIILTGNIVGLYNVIMHEDTTKNSWNIPINEIVNFVDKNSLAKDKILIYSHDPIITWTLQNKGYELRSPYNLKKEIATTTPINIIIIETYQGKISSWLYKKMTREINEIKYKEKYTLNFKKDKYYRLKKHLDDKYPEYIANITILKNVSNVELNSSWQSKNRLYSKISSY